MSARRKNAPANGRSMCRFEVGITDEDYTAEQLDFMRAAVTEDQTHSVVSVDADSDQSDEVGDTTPVSLGNPLETESEKQTRYTQCGAKKRNGEPCRGAAMPNGRCRIHGGLTPHGFALPQTKTGRYSKYIPQHLKDMYEEGLGDPELLSLREEVNVLTIRVKDLMSKLAVTEPPPWDNVLTEMQKLKRVMVNTKPKEEVLDALYALEDVVKNGIGSMKKQETLWDQIQETIANKAQVASAEWRRMNDLNQIVTVEQALGLVRGIMESQREILRDHPDLLQAIQHCMVKFLPQPSS